MAKTLRILSLVDGPLREWLMNRKVISAMNLTPQQLELAARLLRVWRPTLLWAFSSAAFQLARYVRETGPENGPLVPYAILTGEPVFPFQRREIERSLGAIAIEGYTASDAATIAMQCPVGSMHVHADHAHVEILRDGEPVPTGEFGDIVVTSLSNRAMPLVRYAVGDRGRLSPDPCPCGRPLPVLRELKGRNTDFISAADGRPLHGSAITLGLDDVLFDSSAGGIRQLLFEHVDQRTWRVLVETERAIGEPLREQLANHVRRTFGTECAVTVEVVPTIPREPSGKFRYYRSRQARR